MVYQPADTTPLSPALAEAFKGKLTITAPELCRLMPMDAGTLKRHCRLGTIAFMQTGFGESAPRRFTLEHVLAFIESRNRQAQSPALRGRPVRAKSVPVADGEGALAVLLAKRRAERQQGKPAHAAPNVAQCSMQARHEMLKAERAHERAGHGPGAAAFRAQLAKLRGERQNALNGEGPGNAAAARAK